MTDSHDHAALASRASTIRGQLKQWEHAFAATHNGRKATRDEVKADLDITPLYKEYHSLRDILDGKVRPEKKAAKPSAPNQEPDTTTNINKDIQKSRTDIAPFTSHSQSRKRKRPTDVSNHATYSPSERRQTSRITSTSATSMTTPRRPSRFHEHLSSTPDSAKENRTPASTRRKAFIGPTPQKDGVVLGLFDLLPADEDGDGAADGTPSKSRKQKMSAGRPVLGDVTSEHVVFSTPGKRDNAGDVARFQQGHAANAGPGPMTGLDTPSTNRRRRIRTPQSAGRRYLLDSFVTPSKRAGGGKSSHTFATNNGGSGETGNEGAANSQSPASASKTFGFSTPAFLRRDSSRLAAVAEIYDDDDDEETKATEKNNTNNTRSPHAQDEPLGSDDQSKTQKQNHPWPKPPNFKFSTALSSRLSNFSSSFGSKLPVGANGKPKPSNGSKTLSAMIKDLRRAEDERLDEEMSMLREMEDIPGSGTDNFPRRPRSNSDKNLIGKTQHSLRHENEGALGPDGAINTFISTEEKATEPNGQNPTGRRWKKKGQKRQTRRVILKPKGPSGRSKPNHSDTHVEGSSEDEDGEDAHGNDDNVDAVADAATETQVADEHQDGSDAGHDHDHDHDYEGRSDAEEDSSDLDFDGEQDGGEKPAPTGRKRKRAASASASASAFASTSASTAGITAGDAASKPPRDEGRIAKAARKVNEAAHANYRRLKIRSKGGSSGKGRGRFGRR